MILRSNIIKGKYDQIVHSSRSWWYFMIFYCFWLLLQHSSSLALVIFTSFSVIGRVLGCAGWWVMGDPNSFLVSTALPLRHSFYAQHFFFNQTGREWGDTVLWSAALTSDIVMTHCLVSPVSDTSDYCLIQLINNLKREISFAVLLVAIRGEVNTAILYQKNTNVDQNLTLCKYNGPIPSSTLST